MNRLETINQALFLQINGNTGAPAWMIKVAVGMADYLIYWIPILLIVLWLWGDESKRNLALKACVVAMLGVGINQVIPLFWQHPRPFMLGLGHTWIPHVADSSFPSDHMTVFASIGFTLLFDGVLWVGLVTLLLGLSVAWARIFLGVHFPLDMIGALAVGISSYLILTPIWQKTGATLTQVIEQLYRRILKYPIATGWIRH